jgi:ligand-binding sensor domain-containing protein
MALVLVLLVFLLVGELAFQRGRRMGWATYAVDDGPRGGPLQAMGVAPDGAVWVSTCLFGTYGPDFHRVSRFDGETWTTYAFSERLPDGCVDAIAVAPDGALWFGSRGGDVVRFDGETWTAHEYRLAVTEVEGMALAPDGAVWFGTHGGVSRFDGETWIKYTVGDGLAASYVTSVAVAPDGAVWVGTFQDGVSHFDGETWTTYTESDGLVSNYVRAVAVAPDGAVWFGMGDGISRFDGETWISYPWVIACPDFYCFLQALAVDGQGRVWIGKPNRLDVFDPRAGLPGRTLQVVTRVWRIARAAGIVTSILLVMRWTVLAARSRPATGWRSALLYTVGVGLWAALGAVICGVSTTNWMLFGSPFPAVLGACVGLLIGLLGFVSLVLIQRRAK